jgi:MurNAc alpha-1-phosphate uridylyltransferase
MTRAMILAAGLGTRMRPLTARCPKPLIPIAGTTLIEHNIHQLKANGITDIVINLGYLGHMIESYLGTGAGHGVRIQYTYESPDQLLGSGGGVKHALSLLGEAPFVLVSADIWWTMSLGAVIAATQSRQTVLWATKNPAYHRNGDFTLSNRQVTLNHADHNATFSGIGIFCPSYFSDVDARIFGLDVIIKQSVTENTCTGHWVDGIYENVGTPEQITALEKRLQATPQHELG